MISVPSGRAGNGVPTGIQIVARTCDDVRVFRAAAAYERALGGFDLPRIPRGLRDREGMGQAPGRAYIMAA